MRRSAALAILPAVSALALLGAACSSDDKGASDTTTTSTTAATTSSTSTTAATGSTTTTAAAGVPACNTSQLQGELGPSDAGAGQVYAPLILRNTSSTTCEVKGFPGVSVVDGSGAQIGQPATREGNEGGAVILQPGGVASATLHTTNAGIGGPCEPTSAQIKVFPPSQTEALTFSADYTVCGGFSVTTLVPGDTGTA
jgi:hypothetical protein